MVSNSACSAVVVVISALVVFSSAWSALSLCSTGSALAYCSALAPCSTGFALVLRQLCLSSLFLHLHMDLALYPVPLFSLYSTSLRLEAASWWGALS